MPTVTSYGSWVEHPTVLGPAPGPVSPSYSVWRRAIHLFDVRHDAATTPERVRARRRLVCDPRVARDGPRLRVGQCLDPGDGLRVPQRVRGSRAVTDARTRYDRELLGALPEHRSPHVDARRRGSAGEPRGRGR